MILAKVRLTRSPIRTRSCFGGMSPNFWQLLGFCWGPPGSYAVVRSGPPGPGPRCRFCLREACPMPWPSWCAASPSRPGCRMCASTSRSATRRRLRAPRRVRRERCAPCGWRPARSRADDDTSSPIDWVGSGLRAASEGKHSDMGGGWRCKGATDRIFCAQRTAHAAQRQSHGHVGPPYPQAIAPCPGAHTLHCRE